MGHLMGKKRKAGFIATGTASTGDYTKKF